MDERISHSFLTALPNQIDKTAVKNIKSLIIQFHILGDETFCISITDGVLEVTSGLPEFKGAHLELTLDKDDFLSLIKDRVSLPMLFLAGRVQANGSLHYLTQFAELFPNA